MSQPTSPSTNRKNLICRVLMLDDTVEIFYVLNKSLGGILFSKVIQKLHLLEADYFDLQYRNVEGIVCWLDHEKQITSHLPQNSLNFEFVVKFYTPDPGMLEEELTRYLFALQVKRDLSAGRMPCQEQTAALLASYIVQAEFGDLTDEDFEKNPDYLNTFKFFPYINQDIETRIMQHHREHFGQTPMEADYNLLDTARKVEFYGICMHDAMDHEGVMLHLAVTHMGVVVFQNMTRINTFSWAKIRKLSFKRKKFLIKLHPEGYGFYKDSVEFYFSSRNECKNFWKKCLEHHAFFRCQSVKKIPRNKTRVVSHGSSFRYSGKTQKQLVDYVRENFSKRPSNFSRSTSMRTVNFGSGLTPRTGTLRSLRLSRQHQHESSEKLEDKNVLSFSPAKDDHRSSMIFEHTIINGSNNKYMNNNTHTLPKESKSSSADENGKNQVMPKKDELVPQIRTKGTVDDFHFSYFTCINSNGTSVGTSKHQGRKSHQDNASQDSYHLHESRGSLDFDSKTSNSFDELESRMCVVDAEMHHFESSVPKSNHNYPDVILRGKSLAELSFLTKRISDLDTTEDVDEQCGKFSKVRPATVAYDLSADLAAQTKAEISYTTDVDSLSLHEEPVIENFYEKHLKTSQQHIHSNQNDKMSGPPLPTTVAEECVTVVDSKEDGIQYILHRRHMHSKDKDFSDLDSKNQNAIYSSNYLRHRTDMEKVRSVLNNLTSMHLKPNEVFQGRLKAIDYIMYKKLPRRDSFSSKDDSIESSLLPKESYNIWRKVKDEKSFDVKQKTTCDYLRKGVDLEETDFPIIELISERKPHTIVEYDADKVLGNDNSMKSGEIQISPKLASLSKNDCNLYYYIPSLENIKQYCYMNNIKMLPFCELLKMENLYLSLDVTYKRRQLFRTAEKLQNFTGISSSFKTGFATGSSSSFSVNDELEAGFKLDSLLCCSRAVTSSKNGISSCGSPNDTYANIDKHGHVIEWLEEQQAIFKPYSFFHEISKSFVGSRQPYSDLIRNSENYSPSHHFSAPCKETSSLPGSILPEFFYMKKSLKPIQTQSSFGTQSFPEPLIDISSDDVEEDKNEEDFYDVNRILDYVATNNQFYMRDELPRHDFGEFSDVEELINEREVKLKEKKSGKSRIKTFISYVSQDDSLINTKVINSDVWHKSQGKVFAKSISIASTHEEEHISDILDALGGYEVTDDPVDYSDIDAESWDCLDGESKLLTDSLVYLEQVDLTSLKGLNENLNTLYQAKNLENTPVQEPQVLETSLLPNTIEIITSCAEEISMKNSDHKISKPQHNALLGHYEKDITYPTEYFNPNIKMLCNAMDTNDSIISVITEPMVFWDESWNEHGILYTNDNYLQVKKPMGIKSDAFMGVCETLNKEFTLMRVEIGMEVKEDIEMAFLEFCPKIKKIKAKPKRVPDKFELFLAGVKVNLENILARDSACENRKAEITHSRYHKRISQHEKAFIFNERLLIASCENVIIQSNVSNKSIMRLLSRNLCTSNVMEIGFKMPQNHFFQTILEHPFCENVKKETRRGRIIISVFMV